MYLTTNTLGKYKAEKHFNPCTFTYTKMTAFVHTLMMICRLLYGKEMRVINFCMCIHVNNVDPICPFMCSYFGFMLSAAVWKHVLGSPSSTQCSEWLHCFPCKEHYCPHSAVNWLITSLMRMERPVTMGHIVRW